MCSNYFKNIVLLIFLFAASTTANNECKPRSYGKSSVVCVCSAEYCDTIDPVERLETGKYVKYTSDEAGKRFQKTIGNIETTSIPKTFGTNHKAAVDITIDRTKKYQQLIGWGGAFTDAVGINLLSLSDDAQTQLLNAYFSENGIEYNMARIPIGGTDFSLNGYSYDDNNDEEDKDLIHFKLQPEDFKYKIPFIKKAYEISQEKLLFLASAWTAPKWMKTNGKYDGIGKLKRDMYQTWANYFLKFLDSYQKEGISFWGVTTGNEPSLSLLPFSKINSVGWSANDMSQWIANNIGPTLRNSNYSDIKLIALDDQRFFLPWFINKIFDLNQATKEFVDGVAVHWYWDWLIPAKQLLSTHEAHPDKFILATESCRGDKAWEDAVVLGAWERADDYSHAIIEDLNNWVTGWIDWNIVLNLQGGPTYISNFVDSPIIVNETAGEFYKQPMYYAMGHFSKFLPNGSVRIDSKSSSTDKNIQYVAFQRPDNGTAIALLNRSNTNKTITVGDDQNHAKIIINISAKSLTTVMYW